jgi:hypothetical protein
VEPLNQVTQLLHHQRKFGDLLVAILFFFFLFPGFTNESTRPADQITYLSKYLELFPNLELAEVLAVIWKESRCNPTLKFYEATVNDYSYGPMQVRLRTARGLGFTGKPKDLLTWEHGLYYGMKYLSFCKTNATKTYLKENGVLNKHIVRKRTFASYNAGGVYYKVDDVGEQVYINRDYVLECDNTYWRHYRYNTLKLR